MKSPDDLYHFGIRSTIAGYQHAVFAKAWLALILFFTVLGASAQTMTWSDKFTQGVASTADQCNKWNNFRSQLAGKSFAAVTISGTFDETGKTLSDPASATALAQRLSSGTPGVITFGGQTWAVGTCGGAVCGGLSVTLSVNGSTNACNCADTYAIKPGTGMQWGGVNTSTCSGPSQEMRLVFHSAVSIIANGPTEICPGGSVILTASTQGCNGPYEYLWSNEATTQSISVSEAGSYSVQVIGNGCSGISSPTVVSVLPVSVDAGEEARFCTEPVQLIAKGTSTNQSTVHKFCIFDAPGGAGNCTFPANEQVCDNALFYTSGSFSTTVSLPRPDSVRYKIYYSNFSASTRFLFKVNNNVIGIFSDTDPTMACNTRSEKKFPRTFRFHSSQFVWEEGNNTLTVEVVSGDPGVYLAGVAAEVDVPNAGTYSWTPTTGLSNPSIANPLASPDFTTTYTVSYNDGVCTVFDQVKVINCNTPPTAICKPVVAETTTTCDAMVDAIKFNNESISNTGGALSYSVFPAGPYPVGETVVTLTVTDLSNNKSSTCTTTITVNDVTSPVISVTDVVAVNDAGVCSATVPLEEPETSDNCGIATVSHDQPDTTFPVGETIVTWTVTDIHGNIKTATQKVTVNDAEDPVVTIIDLVAENEPGTCSATVTLTPPAAADNCGIATIAHDQVDATFPVGETIVTWTVTDVNENIETATQKVTVTDTESPVVTVTDVVVSNEPGACSAIVMLQPPATSDNCGVATIKHDQADEIFLAGEPTIVTWTVTDVHGNVKTATQKVTVTNDVPVISSVSASASTVQTFTPVSLNISYTDMNNNVQSATIDWGDLSGPQVVQSPSEIFDVTHAYATAGTYAITITVTDLCSATSAPFVYESITVTGKLAGYVEGSGWFNSLPGYYREDRRASGKAHFGFEAQYSKGGALQGNATFKFKAGRLQFASNDFELLQIDDENAFLTGSGKLNGKKGYGILISMVDNDKNDDDNDFSGRGKDGGKGKPTPPKKSDHIRVKIWDSKGKVVYDTQLDADDQEIATTHLGGGDIKVNNSDTRFDKSIANSFTSNFGEGSTSVYPNPFADWIEIRLPSSSQENIQVELMDLTGKVVYSAQLGVNEDGTYSLNLPEDKNSRGIFILRVSQGRRVEIIRMVRE